MVIMFFNSSKINSVGILLPNINPSENLYLVSLILFVQQDLYLNNLVTLDFIDSWCVYLKLYALLFFKSYSLTFTL